MAAGDDGGTPKDFDECVSQGQLQAFMDATQDRITEAVAKAVTDSINGLRLADIVGELNGRIATITDRVAALEARPPPPPPPADEDVVYDAHGNIDQAATREARIRRRVRANVGGNRAPDDPYAKVKFTIPSFSGHYDAEGYLDWEMTVEQKFSAHLVPEPHRVRQATSEFKDFAIIWWTGLVAAGVSPTTWEQLKVAMRDRFVPPSYHRELRKNLMRLDQGDKSVQDYYGELQKGLMRCGIVEGTEDSICRFYSGLRREIQDIVDYKDFNSVNQLFQLAMFAEKELQGRELQGKSKVGNSYQRTTPSLGLTKASYFRVPPPASTRPADSGVSTTPKPPPARSSVSGKNSLQVPGQSASSVASTGCTIGLQCHRCKGFGHMQKECPSQRAYIATEDGGYISTSDIEDDVDEEIAAEDT